MNRSALWRIARVLAVCGLFVQLGCRGGEPSGQKSSSEPKKVELPPPPVDPVPLWQQGQTSSTIDASERDEEDYLVLDVGDEWTPYLFTDGIDPEGNPVAHDYRPIYLALAAGQLPKDHHGQRAKRDKYLELYGIPPTLTLLRERFRSIDASECVATLDLEPLRRFDRFLSYERNRKSERQLRKYRALKPRIDAITKRAEVENVWVLDVEGLSEAEQKSVGEYKPIAMNVEAIMATQKRLQCEGYFKGKSKPFVLGVFDWVTHEALAEFERRHRVFGWAFIGRDTIHVLRKPSAELEQEAVIRVLTERAMHAAKALEDGSANLLNEDGRAPRYMNARGEMVQIPNLEAEIRQDLIDAFGLHSPESTLAWLNSLGEIGSENRVAFRGPALPEYYSDDMALYVEIDRGDVWYDFPWDEEGKRKRQRVKRRPKLTVFVRYRDQKIPIAHFGSTIGGWRTEFIEGTKMWRYKDSPVGPRVWKYIASAPVWVPPESTPPRSLLLPARRNTYVFNKHEMGPSYASAYGLVAAYHRRYRYDDTGALVLGSDQGIRTHGSVDYMSIMRRFSHGCHRLHNHLAVRLMSFVLKHKPHERRGHQVMDYQRDVEYEQEIYELEFTRGGYFFDLKEPVWVEVVEGNILGEVEEPIASLLPKFDEELGAYVMPDGTWANVNHLGEVTLRQMPEAMQPVMTSVFDLPAEGLPMVEETATPENSGETLIPLPSPKPSPSTVPMPEPPAAPAPASGATAPG